MTTRPGVNVTASAHHVSTPSRTKAARVEYDLLSPKTCLRPSPAPTQCPLACVGAGTTPQKPVKSRRYEFHSPTVCAWERWGVTPLRCIDLDRG